jgi:(+)-trans-carveol dehydrogenase
MGRVEGKVAFITGAARGQGRAIATRLAAEGADIIAVDLCEQIGTVPYALSTADDLAETAKAVEALDRRIMTAKADVRSLEQVQRAVDQGAAEIGPVDIVCANAGVFGAMPSDQMDERTWQDMIDVNLTGVWNTVRATLPGLKARGRGSVILTSSTAGIKGFPAMPHYSAAKHGVVGLMKSLVAEFGPYGIRVNTIHPTAVNTPMIHNDAMYGMFRPDLDKPGRDDFAEVIRSLHELPEPWVEPADIAEMALFLASDASRYVTGSQLRVDLGYSEK